IPAAMPAVLSVCMTVGASALAKEEAIVSKLVAIDEMAGVDVLCADKTGTITKNELSVGEVKTFEKYAANDVLLYASLASREEDKDPIDDAIIAKAKTIDGVPASISGYKISSFKPFDPVSKRTEATAQGKDGPGFQVTKGAPQVVLSLLHDKGVEGAVNGDVNAFAEKGYRALGVARTDGGKDWKFVGLIALSDPPREDSAATIKAAESMGITVKMVTGDHVAIAKEVAREVGLGTNIVTSSSILGKSDSDAELEIEKVDGFAEVFPEHKYKIVELLQKKGHIVCMTGDGVNDAPALKKADCGIAVAGATDAAKSAAAVVLTKPGLSVIIDAVTESRKIFQRMTNYAIYRISETFRVLFFISLSIIAFQLYPVTALMIVLLALLNDMPIMTIAYDNVKISQKPEKWNMRKLLTISSFLGGIGTASSFGMLIIGLDVLHLNPLVLQSFIYLKLSVAGHLELFVARTKGRFWSVRPAKVLLLAVILTQFTATIITVYGILLPAMGWELAGVVWGYALASFLVTDFLKVGFYGRLNRESENLGKEEAANVLRTVTPDRAFTFYRDYGQPLHVTSRSLAELAASLKTIEPSSVRFHVEEEEFENWFAMLGDESLARQVAKLRGKDTAPDKLRAKVSEMVGKRVEELHKIAGAKEKGAKAPSVSRLHKLESAITSRLHGPGKKVGKDEAANALRTVTPDKAFTFYDAVGKPLGVTSKSLDEFAASVKSVDPTSVKFHLEKGDFEGWFAMLGDKSLAGQVAKLRGKDTPPDKLRERVGSIVGKRVEELHKIADPKKKGERPPFAGSDKTKDAAGKDAPSPAAPVGPDKKNTADKDTGRLHRIESAIRSRLHMVGKDLGKDEAAKALRTVTPDMAFTFYSETGKPLGALAKSLDEFATVLKGVDPSSVKFHVEEGDFEKWFAMLGDESLASQVAKLRGKSTPPDKLREEVSEMVGKRVEQLHKIAGLKGPDSRAPSVSPAKAHETDNKTGSQEM
ncbi:MAG TPA: plasma-membrane proton-efflux P-type ATPase, partial [Nitrososphaerales archaeon]|nr:plasma-membrane proton-efflux P-type ATPase [Nitrososphaerales archaeon]